MAVKGNRKRGKGKVASVARFEGVRRHARELGVNPGHLWHVLSGARQSLSLMARYRSLRRERT